MQRSGWALDATMPPTMTVVLFVLALSVSGAEEIPSKNAQHPGVGSFGEIEALRASHAELQEEISGLRAEVERLRLQKPDLHTTRDGTRHLLAASNENSSEASGGVAAGSASWQYSNCWNNKPWKKCACWCVDQNNVRVASFAIRCLWGPCTGCKNVSPLDGSLLSPRESCPAAPAPCYGDSRKFQAFQGSHSKCTLLETYMDEVRWRIRKLPSSSGSDNTWVIQDHFGSPAITSADQNKAVRIHKGVLEIDSVDTPIQCHAGGGNPSICDEGWSGDYHGTINGVTMNSEGCSNKCWDRSACTVTLVEDGTGTAKTFTLPLKGRKVECPCTEGGTDLTRDEAVRRILGTIAQTGIPDRMAKGVASISDGATTNQNQLNNDCTAYQPGWSGESYLTTIAVATADMIDCWQRHCESSSVALLQTSSATCEHPDVRGACHTCVEKIQDECGGALTGACFEKELCCSVSTCKTGRCAPYAQGQPMSALCNTAQGALSGLETTLLQSDDLTALIADLSRQDSKGQAEVGWDCG